jgi:hypothetical protein
MLAMTDASGAAHQTQGTQTGGCSVSQSFGAEGLPGRTSDTVRIVPVRRARRA